MSRLVSTTALVVHRQPPALQKVLKLLLDETGQAFSIAETRGLRAKRLEVIVHDLVQCTLRRTSGFVAGRGRGHRKPGGARRASEEPGAMGLHSRPCQRKSQISPTSASHAMAVLPPRGLVHGHRNRPSLKAAVLHGAQAASRAAPPPSDARGPLMPPSTVLR